ncbi:Cyclin dependent protein kinase [Spraguea lophii 42_110]|uniref:Cyclin-dependent kinase 1 n=1 Tax=Spraguea lophii (strain 42_110) TaxID=1358809 RepID=S7XPQ8_SPRLO|nr:Cyclin dependent protein kinase [Spraguea lophii 42_110]
MFIDTFYKIEKIGEGTYGVVYRAYEKGTDNVVALKKIKIDEETKKEGITPTTLREITILRDLDHPSILKLNDVFFYTEKLFLVFEYIPNDLRSFLDECLKRGKNIQKQFLKRMAYQIISGVDYCHKRGILHRDIKPQNILMDRSGNMKLADFGLARVISVPLRTYTHDIITLWYRPPELLLGFRHYSYSVDIWSIGCIVAELRILRPLFPGDSEIDQIFRIFKIMGTPTEDTWPGVTKLPNFVAKFKPFDPIDLRGVMRTDTQFHNFLTSMITLNPKERKTASELLDSDFLKDLNKENKY